jgi:alcohol dehydrogenase (cytochrome c)
MQWVHQFPGETDDIESTPLVRNGMMYVTVPPNQLLCLDAATGRTMWVYKQRLAYELPGEFGQYVNRGAAILGDKVFIGSGDARVTAVDARTGKELWQTVVSDEPLTYYISAAPLVLRDQVVIGVGTRGGGRGFVASFDAETGKERWRFTTIPGPGEKGNDTWAGDSWKRGGAPTWLTGSYDPELDLLYWGIGNPKPDYDGTVRRGDNLYSDSVVALRGSTGEKVWHFQFTPADDHDWDSNQIPVLADLTSNGETQKRILWANRNGFYYVLDRVTGRYITSTPFVRQTWTTGMDAAGRPQPRAESERTAKGFLLFPGNTGGTNWWSPSYDPALSLMFVPALEWGGVYYSSVGSWPAGQAGAPFYTAIRALDAETGKRVWEYRQELQQNYVAMGGLLSTKTGLLFAGDQQRFFALRSRTGEKLWSVESGGKIVAAPITYEVDGRQYVTIAAGRALISFALPGRSQPSAGVLAASNTPTTPTTHAK